ncbi:hypothetical protein BH09VER1_BH09VER1_43820 [soil metagenome]
MTPKLTKLVSVLAVRDHRASAKYYCDMLGFTIDHEDDDWIMLERDAARIHLGNCPDVIHASEIGYHNAFATILVDNIEALEAEFLAKGAFFRQRLTEKHDWRDFVITTPDGHVIVFGQLPSQRGS